MDPLPRRITPPMPIPNDIGNSDAAGPSSDLPSWGSSGSRSRSCVHCRFRKIKCDRQVPCAACVRSGSQCKYPAGPGRAPKRPRRAVDPRVLDRLSRLEVIMNQMGSDRDEDNQKTDLTRPKESKIDPCSVDQQLGRLVIDDTRSCYVSNKLWANLTDEVSYAWVIGYLS